MAESVRFQVLTAPGMITGVLWIEAPSSLMDVFRYFRCLLRPPKGVIYRPNDGSCKHL